MIRAGLVLVVICCAVSCARASNALRVERVLVDVAIGRFEPFDRRITDPTDVSELEATIRALPPTPPDLNQFCPIAWGHRYRLTFSRDDAPTLVATAEADGCRYLYLGPWDRRFTTEAFWARLAGALGYYTRGNDLFPLPRDMRR